MVNGLHIVAILVIAYAAQRMIGHFIEKVIKQFVTRGEGTEDDENKREATLVQILS